MLQLKLEVNGHLIDFVNIVNVSSKQDPATYEVTYQGKSFGFTHNRSEGALVCAMKAMKAIVNEAPSLLEQEAIDSIMNSGRQEGND